MLMQARKLGAQVVGWVWVGVVVAKQFVDQVSGAQARVDVGCVGVVLDDANGQPGLVDRQVGLFPCERVVDLGGEYGLDYHLPVLVGDMQFVVDTIATHDAEEVVDLGRVGTTAHDDHLSLWVVDVWDAVEDRLVVVDLGVDEVLHVQVRADWATECLLVVIECLELY